MPRTEFNPPKKKFDSQNPEVYRVAENIIIPHSRNKRPPLERVTCYFPEIVMTRFHAMSVFSGMSVHELLRLAAVEFMSSEDAKFDKAQADSAGETAVPSAL
jgi:hypothetical protein